MAAGGCMAPEQSCPSWHSPHTLHSCEEVKMALTPAVSVVRRFKEK